MLMQIWNLAFSISSKTWTGKVRLVWEMNELKFWVVLTQPDQATSEKKAKAANCMLVHCMFTTFFHELMCDLGCEFFQSPSCV